jgi:hypothetical protein
MDVWFARCGTDLSPASLAILRQLLIDAMGHLGSGFGSPHPPAGPGKAHLTSTAQATATPTLLKERL